MALNFVFNLVYQLFAIIVPLITAPYLARVLGPTNQGIYSYVHSITYIISLVSMLGIYNYGNRQTAYVRDDKIRLSQTFYEIMTLRAVLGIAGTVVFVIVSICQPTYRFYFGIYYIYLLSQYIDCTWVFVGLEEMKTAVIKNFGTKVLSTIGIFAFVKTENDVSIYLLILGLSVFISNLLAYSQLKKYIVRTKISFENLKTHLLETAKLFLPSLAVLIYMQIDKIMIENLTGDTAQVAFYDNSEKIVTIALTIITVMSTVLMPRMANEYRNNNSQNVKNWVIFAGKLSLFAAFPMMFGIAAISADLIPWYLGVEYTPVIKGIMVLSPVVLSNALEGVSGKQYFTATNQINVLTTAYTITAVFNVILNALLIPKYGFVGATIATLVSSYCSVVIQYYKLNKQVKLRLLVNAGRKYAIAALIMYASVVSIAYYLPSTPIATLFEIVLGGTIYIAICLCVKDEMLMQGIILLKQRLKKP